MGEELETVKISAASLRLVFHDCNAEFIKSVCQGRCCRSSTRPEGTLIAIHPSEAIQIEALGGVVVNGLLQSVSRHCPFQNQQSFLCSLHASGKTDIFEVVAKEFRGEEEILGEIRWYAPWRCYAFCVDEYVFEHQCLSDLARCCFSLTSDHLLARTRGRKQK